jgi:hypothetical protein
MADPIQAPRLADYASDLLRQSYQQTPISPENLAVYGQGMMQQVPAPPQIESYAAPQQMQQQYMQPNADRVNYMRMVEDRFNQIANAVGGMEVLAVTGRIDKARQRAQKDIEMMYGPAPSIEPQIPLQQFDIGGRQFARGGIFGKQVTEVTPPEPKKEAPSEAMNTITKKAADYISTVDPMLGQLESAIVQIEDPNVDPNTRLSSARTLGKLINSLQVGSPDAVGAEEARMLLTELNENIINPRGVFTSETIFGTNLPQFTSKMKLLRDRVAEQYNAQRERVVKADPTLQEYFQPRQLFTTPQQTGEAGAGQTGTGQPAPEGVKRRVFVPGKGFQ